MGLIEYLDKLVVEHGSAAVLDKHLAFVREQAAALEKKVADLETENAALKKRVGQLETELSAKVQAEDFIEQRGALFKRKPGGGYHAAVYCPRCRIAVSSGIISGIHARMIPYHCSCGWTASFGPGHLSEVMGELP